MEVKREEVPNYLKKGWGENRWQRIARYRLRGGIKESIYWEKKEKRLCRVCEEQIETWEHVWEDCDRWGAEGSWNEMMGEEERERAG